MAQIPYLFKKLRAYGVPYQAAIQMSDPDAVDTGGGVTDHGALTGLLDDDHPQYHNDTRGDVRYYTKTQADSTFATPASVTTAISGAAPATNMPAGSSVYPVSAYGFVSVSTMPEMCQGQSTVSSGMVRMWVPGGVTITGAGAMTTSPPTVGAGGENSFAIYDNSGNKVTQTVTDNALWTTGGWRFKDFPTPIASQTAGRFVYLGFTSNGLSGSLTFMFAHTLADHINGGKTAGHIRSVFFASRTSWPSTLLASSGTTYAYLPLVVLY